MNHQQVVADKALRTAKWTIVIGTLAAAAGILATLISYMMAGPGEQFYVFWYLPVIGIILVIRGFRDHSDASRIPAFVPPAAQQQHQAAQPPQQSW